MDSGLGQIGHLFDPAEQVFVGAESGTCDLLACHDCSRIIGDEWTIWNTGDGAVSDQWRETAQPVKETLARVDGRQENMQGLR